MKQHLTLDYTLPTGVLTPYFDALQDGKALASACPACGHIAFPARTLCARCDLQSTQWVELSGRATVLLRSDSARNSFALAQFDGADTQSTVAISNPQLTSPIGTLMPPREGKAGIWITLTDTRNGKNNEL